MAAKTQTHLHEMLARPSESSTTIPGMNLSPEIKHLHESHQTKGYELVFKGINKTIDKNIILSDINGVAEPGELLAIMGPSGAGKSTLLNAIAGRLPIDSGKITLNSHTLTKQMRRKISYVLQADTFLTELTFWDTIWFTALLRFPGSMPSDEKKRRVYEIIDALDMRKCLNTIIGDQNKRGLSGGERKRANIACELLTNPALMLLDEPTSGLDSSTAFSLISTLKSFAVKSGKTIVVTIHQPSSQIYNMFDKLLLLCEGKTAYFGEAPKVAEHLSFVGLDCPPNYNISDFMLDVVKDASDETKSKLFEKALEQRLESSYPVCLKEDDGSTSTSISMKETEMSNREIIKTGGDNPAFDSLEDIEKGITTDVEVGEKRSNSSAELSSVDSEDSDFLKYRDEYNAKWPTSFWLQYCVLSRRALKQAIPLVLSKMNVIQTLMISAIIGLLYFRTKPEENFLSDRTGVIFFPLVYIGFQGFLHTVGSLPIERPVINKERLAGYYRLSAYFMAKTTSEMPLILLQPFVFISIIYWISGINYSFSVYIQMVLITLMSTYLTSAMGFMLGCLILDYSLLFVSSTTGILLSMIAGGFYVEYIPSWLSWMEWLSFLRYLYLALLQVDIDNNNLRCNPVGTQFCYNMTFPRNATDPSDPRLPIIPKDRLHDKFTLKNDGYHVWHYLIVVFGFMVIFRVLAYIILRYIRKPKTV